MPEHLPQPGRIEWAPDFEPRPDLRVVLFDWDGTLSLLRSGWADVMTDLYAAALPPLPGETAEARRRLARSDILGLNGRQTLHQMIRLTERIRERGGQPREPHEYKQDFLHRLAALVGPRQAAIRSGRTPPDTWLVPGARTFLQQLRNRGLVLHLASGTDERALLEEIQMLGLADFFGPRVHGARDESFTKADVIQRLLIQHAIQGRQLLAFGDGVVEIRDIRAVDGLAVGVAVDETAPDSGRLDPDKRRMLRDAGAQGLIPDFRDGPELLRVLLGETTPLSGGL